MATPQSSPCSAHVFATQPLLLADVALVLAPLVLLLVVLALVLAPLALELAGPPLVLNVAPPPAPLEPLEVAARPPPAPPRERSSTMVPQPSLIAASSNTNRLTIGRMARDRTLDRSGPHGQARVLHRPSVRPTHRQK